MFAIRIKGLIKLHFASSATFMCKMDFRSCLNIASFHFRPVL